MSVFLYDVTDGDVYDGAAHNAANDQIEASFDHLGPLLVSGLAISAGTGLAVDVATGTAFIGGHLVVSVGFSIGGLTPSTLNHIYLLQNGTGTANTTGTQPADSLKLGTATTDGSGVTAVGQNWASGRQTKRRTEDLVHGSGAGHPRAVDLSSWHASNNEGSETKGVLPAGALPATGARTDTAQTWTADQTFANGTDLILQTGAGSMIGTAASQKLGLWGATPVVQPANTSELRALLISVGLLATGGANDLNLNGGNAIVNQVRMSEGFRGSGQPVRMMDNTITPGSDADVTVSTPESDFGYQQLETGSWASGHNVILPTVTNALYIVKNNTAFSAVFKTAAGSGVTVAAGMTAWIRCGGANYVRVTADVA